MAASSCTLATVNGERNVTPFLSSRTYRAPSVHLTGNEEFGGASDVTQPEMKNSAVPAANPKAVKGALRRALSFAAESHAGEQHPKPGEGRYRQALPGPWGSLTKTGPPDWILVK